MGEQTGRGDELIADRRTTPRPTHTPTQTKQTERQIDRGALETQGRGKHRGNTGELSGTVTLLYFQLLFPHE